MFSCMYSGTGKTLVARALANECSSGERRVAFFMRKGADCLSKWVGESERQLRLLFDQVPLRKHFLTHFIECNHQCHESDYWISVLQANIYL